MNECRLILRLKNDSRIEFVADNWEDAFKAYFLMRRLMERAERTAELMERVNSMSSQCLDDYETVKGILTSYAPNPGNPDCGQKDPKPDR